MKILYQCEYCGNTFSVKQKCADCEKSHMPKDKALLYDLKWSGKDPCDYCKHSYYVYGCERDCSEDKCRAHSRFIAVEPLHDKRRNGGV